MDEMTLKELIETREQLCFALLEVSGVEAIRDIEEELDMIEFYIGKKEKEEKDYETN